MTLTTDHRVQWTIMVTIVSAIAFQPNKSASQVAPPGYHFASPQALQDPNCDDYCKRYYSTHPIPDDIGQRRMFGRGATNPALAAPRWADVQTPGDYIHPPGDNIFDSVSRAYERERQQGRFVEEQESPPQIDDETPITPREEETAPDFEHPMGNPDNYRGPVDEKPLPEKTSPTKEPTPTDRVEDVPDPE